MIRAVGSLIDRKHPASHLFGLPPSPGSLVDKTEIVETNRNGRMIGAKMALVDVQSPGDKSMGLHVSFRNSIELSEAVADAGELNMVFSGDTSRSFETLREH